VLLRGPSPLTAGERDLIASRVSAGNECKFCATCHKATAAELVEGGAALVDAVVADFEGTDISPKLKALLRIADKVRADARTVTAADIDAARSHGALDADIHDTVLIAAMFCMFNKYVDGLAAYTPTEAEPYRQIGVRLAREGYLTVPGLHTADPGVGAHRR
jgi:uncharacterized peroxidase-related enzyme